MEVRFHLDSADWLTDDLKWRLRSRLGHKITQSGFYCVRSEKTRSQTLNKVFCPFRFNVSPEELSVPKMH